MKHPSIISLENQKPTTPAIAIQKTHKSLREDNETPVYSVGILTFILLDMQDGFVFIT